MIKLLIGGSPCTYWSIAQKANREVEAEGMGWELFRNYLIAKEKFKPDFFLYENNKSAAQPIKDQISRELGVELMHINSALVSAQNRQRFYAFNWEVEQPEDRGIQLRDVLEPCVLEQSYELQSMTVRPDSVATEPIRVGHINSGGQGDRIYDVNGKSCSVTANGGGAGGSGGGLYAEPVRIGTITNNAKNKSFDSQQYRVYSPEAKSVTLCGNGGGVGAKTGLYLCPTTGEQIKNLYEVSNGLITVKGKQYPIKLADGYYIIRKLTPTECERLQTLPDGYTEGVSNAQRYKGLGNGWTAEVIIHILNGVLKDVPRDEEIVVLSMYDGIGTGRYCLDKMGFTNVTYYAYEIDEPAMKVALSNYPDIIQLGDAFNLRRDDWELGKTYDDAPPAEKPEHKPEKEDTTEKPDTPVEIEQEVVASAEPEKHPDSEGEAVTTERSPEVYEPPATFDAVEQLKRLAAERKALANIHPENDRFTNDARAIEYAVSVLETVCGMGVGA